MKNLITKKSIISAILVVVSLVSIFGISKISASPKFHSKTIEYLDQKKAEVMSITAATAVTGMGLAAVPSETTTPIANKITDLSSYLIIVLCAILLEKILLSLAGYITFVYIVPISCVLFIIHMYLGKKVWKNIAIKLLTFGLVIVLIVPASSKIGMLITEMFKTQQNYEELTISQNFIDESSDEGFWSQIKDGVSKGLEKTKNTATDVLNGFVDAIAMLLITACVIPIGVLFCLVWFIKLLLGIEIKIPEKIPLLKVKEKECKKEELISAEK